jgi:S1-C subfamily serine protease
VTPVADAVALDAYSQAVSAVADALLPSVASLRVTRGRPAGAGSAVVITPDGFLLTSAHVVARADGGSVTFTNGGEATFTVVGVDQLSDLAVVRADANGLDPATLGDASALRVGHLVVAVGNPLGYTGSVSAGVVSALGRSLTTSTGRSARVVEDVIQTDAALHPGSSGGALADTRARVVGISTAVVGPWVGQGLGLAVPINETTRRVVAALMREGRVRRAWLGVAGGSRPLPPRAAAQTGRQRGVEVLTVIDGSPAAGAGVRPEDVIVALDGHPVETVGGLQALLSEERIDSDAAVEVVRGGRVFTVQTRLTELSG